MKSLPVVAFIATYEAENPLMAMMSSETITIFRRLSVLVNTGRLADPQYLEIKDCLGEVQCSFSKQSDIALRLLNTSQNQLGQVLQFRLLKQMSSLTQSILIMGLKYTFLTNSMPYTPQSAYTLLYTTIEIISYFTEKEGPVE